MYVDKPVEVEKIKEVLSRRNEYAGFAVGLYMMGAAGQPTCCICWLRQCAM